MQTHKSLFQKYRDDSIILKSQMYARWTLPQLMADLLVASGGTQQAVERDYQEFGALLVNNLGTKMAGLLFPTNRPFFKIDVSTAVRTAAKKAGFSDVQLAAKLARMEMDSCQRLFLNATYNQLVLLIKHLIVTGNACLYRNPKTKRSVTYGLDSFAVARDGQGILLDAVIREFTQFSALSEDIQRTLRAAAPHRWSNETQTQNNVELYTRVKRTGPYERGVYEVSQQIEGLDVGKPGKYPERLCPWQFPVWSLIAGEHYGRGLVEDYAGGFAKLSDLSYALALYGINSAKVVNLVAPGASADIDELQKAETGEYVQGDPNAISALESGDANKIAVLRAEIQDIFQNLARAFMYTGLARDSERTTAYELQQQALEAENTLGGTYSVLSEGVQVPLAHILLSETEPDSEAGIISGDMKFELIAGIPALGRSSDIQNLIAATQEAGVVIPALSQLDPRVDPKKVFDLIMAGKSVDTSLLYKSEQRMLEEQAAAGEVAQGAQLIDQSQALLDATQTLQQ